MTDFLLELRSEEIPARMQEKARADLAALFSARLTALNLEYGAVESYATPRRLALIVRDVADATQPMSEERKGPRADAPDQAIQGFLRSTGLTREQLVARDDGKGGQVLFAVIERPGLDAPAVLISACMNAIQSFGWPKSMRWGEASISTESLRWVRPLQGIVAMFGEKIVPFEAAGVKSGATTVGHRFHHPAPVTLGGASDYIEKLRACHVIVDGAERRGIIALGAKMAAAKAGLTLIEDDGLLYENAGLTEWPVPLLGRFDEDFLTVPPEVIQLTARVNQKYFVCAGPDGKLANAFVCTANIDAADGGAKIVEGNQKVLAARLSDARFFYETDLKTRLEDLQPKLEKIVFHEKLGTVADKVDRVAKLARWLVEEGIVTSSPSLRSRGEGRGEGPDVAAPADLTAPSPDLAALGHPLPASGEREKLADQAERAARLAKADLVTGMVGEFPELQGLMGGYYAAAQGEDPAVAEAIRDHYKPVGQGDDVPTAPVTVAVSLADKLDTIASFFTIDERPTGSKDPFALRRAALGVIALILTNGLRRSIYDLFYGPRTQADDVDMGSVVASDHFNDFIIDRLKVQQRDSGVKHDIIDAVVMMGGDDDVGGERDLVRLLARVHALQAFIGTEDGQNLLAGYKRAANILKKESWESADKISLSYTPEAEENALLQALDSAEPLAASAIEREDFEGAMAALAGLRAPIDAFFEKVMVVEPGKREARLSMLARMRAAVHTVADFSKIEG
jgi:glycyl-tRNA synthetase beta chain